MHFSVLRNVDNGGGMSGLNSKKNLTITILNKQYYEEDNSILLNDDHRSDGHG